MPTTSAQSLLIPAAFPSFVHVTASAAFAAADGTALETADANWTKSPGSGAGSATIDANRVHNTSDLALHVYYHAWTPTSADYRVETDVVLVTDNDLSICGPMARNDTTTLAGYAVVYLASSNSWRLARTSGAGSLIPIGSALSQVLTPTQAYRAAVQVRGTTITGFVDGTPFATGADPNIAGPGRAGIYFNNAAAAGVGVHIDNWVAKQ